MPVPGWIGRDDFILYDGGGALLVFVRGSADFDLGRGGVRATSAGAVPVAAAPGGALPEDRLGPKGRWRSCLVRCAGRDCLVSPTEFAFLGPPPAGGNPDLAPVVFPARRCSGFGFGGGFGLRTGPGVCGGIGFGSRAGLGGGAGLSGPAPGAGNPVPPDRTG